MKVCQLTKDRVSGTPLTVNEDIHLKTENKNAIKSLCANVDAIDYFEKPLAEQEVCRQQVSYDYGPCTLCRVRRESFSLSPRPGGLYISIVSKSNEPRS